MHEKYMLRCIELAKQGAGRVAPNPMVGAVLVHDGKIIGEGYHQQYGEAHAEVNCINNVHPDDRHLLIHATLYVSLEPCAHFGKTPPCADLLIQMKIPEVVIGCTDPFEQVDGKGISRLKAAGIRVITPVLEEECKLLNKRFFTFFAQQRPYVILKWAQTANHKIAYAGHQKHSQRLHISHPLTNKLVHRWRSEEAAILVGSHTALSDDPVLTTRLAPGANPVRITFDRHLQLPKTLRLFDGSEKTILFNCLEDSAEPELRKYKIAADLPLVPQLMQALYKLKLLSVIVEGGAATLQSFIDANCWDEARVITNTELFIDNGLNAPVLPAAELYETEIISTDTIQFLRPVQ